MTATQVRRLPRRELGALLVSEAASTAGDQIARLALAVLVFNRTHSAVLSTATIAVSYLPWAVAAPLLAGLGDRYRRRTIMVWSDIYRALVCAALVVPGPPVGVLLVLIFLLTCGEPPFRSARNALLPDLFGDDLYARGQSLMQTVSVTMQFAGYAVGGFLVAAVGARTSLAVDATTFAVSAVALRVLLPSSARPATPARGTSRTGWSIVAGNPVARRALGVAAFITAIDSVGFGLAVPWAHELHHGAGLAGLIASSSLLGATFGGLAIGRITGVAARDRLVLPLGALVLLFLVPFLFVTSPAVTLALLVLSGACSSMQIITQQRFIMAVPREFRARAAGVAGTVINLGQAGAVAVAGLLAHDLSPTVIVGGAGVIGVAGIAVFAVAGATAAGRATATAGSTATAG